MFSHCAVLGMGTALTHLKYLCKCSCCRLSLRTIADRQLVF